MFAHTLLSLLLLPGGCTAPLTAEKLGSLQSDIQINRRALSSITLSESTQNLLPARD